LNGVNLVACGARDFAPSGRLLNEDCKGGRNITRGSPKRGGGGGAEKNEEGEEEKRGEKAYIRKRKNKREPAGPTDLKRCPAGILFLSRSDSSGEKR